MPRSAGPSRCGCTTPPAGGRPVRAGPDRHDVHVRHHAVRRHPPRPRRDLPHLRRAPAAPARPRPRDPLRAQHHRRRRRPAAQGPRARRALPRPGRRPRRPASTTTCAALDMLPSWSEPRATSAIADIRGFIGMVLDRGHAYQAGGAVYFDVSHVHRVRPGRRTTTATQMLELAAERGGNVDDPQQARPARLRPVAAVRRRRAVLGVAVGPGPAGLAHRVLGPGPARARHHHRPARRRRRPDLPAPRVRGGPVRGGHRRAVRAPLDAPGHGPHGRREDVEVARQPGVRVSELPQGVGPAGHPPRPSSPTTTATPWEWDDEPHAAAAAERLDALAGAPGHGDGRARRRSRGRARRRPRHARARSRRSTPPAASGAGRVGLRPLALGVVDSEPSGGVDGHRPRVCTVEPSPTGRLADRNVLDEWRS